MSQLGIVTLVALLGWLVLAVSAYHARRIEARTTVVMALVWGGIFLFVTAVFSALRG